MPIGLLSAASRRAALRTALATVGATAALAAAASPAAAFQVGMQDGKVLDPATQTQALDEMQSLGVRVVRITMNWRDIAACGEGDLTDPNNPCYHWWQYDALVAGARSRGMDVLSSVSGVPVWVNGGKGRFYVGASNADFTRTVDAYAAFMQAAGRRYSAASHVGFIRYWTIWNEPNSRTFWAPMSGDSPRRYALMVARGARGLKAGSPTAKVAPGPTGPNSTGFKPLVYIRKMQPFLKMYGARIDAWAHNPYSGAPVSPRRSAFRAPSVGMGNITDLFRQLDKAAVTRRKPVWMTEFSYQTPPERRLSTSYSNQALWLGDAMDVAWTTRRVPIFVWYVMQDPVASNDWQSGVIASNGARKPSYAMFQRPVGAPASARRGSSVRVWGSSNVSRAAKLVASTNGVTWNAVRSRRGAGGVLTATVTVSRTTYFAVRDAGGIGPARRVLVR